MWHLRIHDPSGQVRALPLEEGFPRMAIGREPHSEITLRDPTLPGETGELSWEQDQFWVRLTGEVRCGTLGGLPVREAQLVPGLPLRIGETTLILEKTTEDRPVPVFPSGVRRWVAASEVGKQLLWTAKKAAATPLSIYVAGETGTGKEVLAHLLHAWSDRASGPFVPLHCGALPLNLAESELFGHVKGSFTGAFQSRTGALMQAHRGTLFLDEVGDLPMDIQVKLLRFLENGEIRQVGSDRSVHVDVRILSATHHSLKQLVEEGKFRRDLFYRMASITLEIPPLRDRLEDITALSRVFAAEMGKGISHRALLRLKSHGWPGNVRELRHAIERASGLAGPFVPLLEEDSFEFLLSPGNLREFTNAETGDSNSPLLTLIEMERLLLLKALKLSQGNRREAARLLGIARSTLFEMLKRHKIPGPKAA